MDINKEQLYDLLIKTFLAGQVSSLHVSQRFDAAMDHADRVMMELGKEKCDD